MGRVRTDRLIARRSIPSAAGDRPGSQLDAADLVGVVGLLALLFAEHFLFGGGNTAISLPFVGLQALALTALLAARPRLRGRLREARGLAGPGLALAGVVLAILWGLTPYVPTGPNPLWSYVRVPGAAALDRSAALVQLVQLAAAACCFALGYLLGGKNARARTFLKGAALCGAAYAFWAFLSFVITPDFVFGQPKRVHAARLTGSFISANTTGAFLAVCVLLGLTWLLAAVRDAPRPLRLESLLQRAATPAVVILLAGAALLLTASRGSIGACAASAVLLIGWRLLSGKGRPSMILGLTAAAAAAGALVLNSRIGAMVAARSAELAVDAGERLTLFTIHWRAFLASPWNGYGLGSFHKVNQLYITSETYPALWNVRAAHNVYLQWLEEVGAVGALLMFATIGLLLAQMVVGAFQRRRMTVWIKGLVACSLVLLIQGAGDYALQLPSIQAFWAALLGVGCSMAADRKTGPRPSAGRAPAAGLAAAAPWAAAALAAFTATTGLWFWLAYLAPALPAAAAAPLAEPAAAEAERLLAERPQTAARTALARALTLKEITLDPASGAGWLRLARIDAGPGKGLNAAAMRDLERSYAVAPLEPSLISPRLPFVYAHWSALTPDLRAQTLRQIELAWPVDQQRRRVMQALPQVPDYGGQIALAMKISSLRLLARLEQQRIAATVTAK